MKNILFPTDFSQTATNAFVYALEIAKGYKANICVLHNYDPLIISSLHAGDPDIVSNIYEKFLHSEEEKFQNYLEILTQISYERKAQNVSLKPLFLQGELTELVADVTQREQIGLVVMGTNGASSLNKKVWGSNTLNVMKHISIPILGVPAQATVLPSNTTSITYGITTLFKETDMVLLADILKLAENSDRQIKIKLLHILDAQSSHEFQMKEKASEWQKYFNSPHLEFVFKKSDNKQKAIEDFVIQEGINLLIMAKRNMDFFEKIFRSSLSEKLVTSFNIPVLVVKENHSKLD